LNQLLKHKRSVALNIVFAALIPILGGWGCHKKEAPVTPVAQFEPTPLSQPLMPIIKEASGMADSKANPGYLWVEEDSGNPAQLYLLAHDGKVLKKIFIKAAVNRDWEDMSLSGSDLFIGDIGDNNQDHSDYTFYKFPEPLATADTVRNFETIQFKYPDGAHDAEAFLIDPETSDIYIITKRDDPSQIFKLAYPYTTQSTVTRVGVLPYSGVTSAAISADGKEIIVKTYTALYYYSHTKDQSISQSLQKDPVQLHYVMEPQGEAVSFAIDHSGFYTLSEQAFFSSVSLNFYKRK
jgi:hypothetical protein